MKKHLFLYIYFKQIKKIFLKENGKLIQLLNLTFDISPGFVKQLFERIEEKYSLEFIFKIFIYIQFENCF